MSTIASDAFISALFTTTIGFWIGYLIAFRWLLKGEFKAAFWLRMLMFISLGQGISGLLQEFAMNPLIGLKPDVDKAAKYLIANVLVFPLIILITKFILARIWGEASATSAEKEALRSELDNSSWAAAQAEWESDHRDKGLYARSLAEANGDEKVAHVNYIRYRASALQREKGISLQKSRLIESPLPGRGYAAGQSPIDTLLSALGFPLWVSNVILIALVIFIFFMLFGGFTWMSFIFM